MKHSKLLLSALLSMAICQNAAFAASDDSSILDTAKQKAQDIAKSTSDAASDATIKTKLATIYSLNAELNKYDISTTVDHGTVYLKGTVQNTAQQELAADIARDVDNVNNVINNLTVDKNHKPKGTLANFGQKITDSTTTAMVKSKLLADTQTSGSQIKVVTTNGVTTLSGKVDTAQEKKLAEKIAQNTMGVKSVRNKLEVNA